MVILFEIAINRLISSDARTYIKIQLALYLDLYFSSRFLVLLPKHIKYIQLIVLESQVSMNKTYPELYQN